MIQPKRLKLVTQTERDTLLMFEREVNAEVEDLAAHGFDCLSLRLYPASANGRETLVAAIVYSVPAPPRTYRPEPASIPGVD